MAKYLIFYNDDNNALCLPSSRLLAVDQTDATSIVLKFEDKDATSSSVTQIDLTVDTGKELEAMSSLLKAISSNEDYATIWDKTSKTSSYFSAISIDLAGSNANGFVPGGGLDGASLYQSWTERNGDVIKTSVLIDLTGLQGPGTIGDIIGTDASTEPAYLGQVTTALNGTIYAGRVSCFEAPTGGDPDINIYAADEGTGLEDTAIGDLTETSLVNTGDHTLGSVDTFSDMPAANQYLYLTTGAVTAAEYTAGRLLIELWGVV